jgi:hypothetical protein
MERGVEALKGRQRRCLAMGAGRNGRAVALWDFVSGAVLQWVLSLRSVTLG